MKSLNIIVACLVTVVLLVASISPIVFAVETEDEAVLAVIQQLEAIDTLQTMQNNRTKYTASSHYDITTTKESIITKHLAARNSYETYVETMFAARVAAQNAYDALTPEQQAQIDPSLTAKLDNELPTVFNKITAPVTPADNEYIFEAVDGGLGYAYEASNHMVSQEIPQTFVLVDTSDGKTSWTPNGLYEYGVSNYDVTYCCDIKTGLDYSSHYKRLNLEDSGYYNKSSAEHIRAIVMNSYPFVTVDEMKASLIEGGLDAEFVSTLTRADMISAVQQSIWTYANMEDEWNNVGYFASLDIPRNTGIYFTPLHDYTNELWDWFPGSRVRSFDHESAYRVNNLTYYLCNLEGVPATEGKIVVSDVNITRASLVPGTDDTYKVSMYVHLNSGAGENDRLTVTATSYAPDGTVTGETAQTVYKSDTYKLSVSAKYGDTITVTVDGTQNLGKGVYFYEPEGGRHTSQCLVGVASGTTEVKAERSFTFNEDIEMGLRIYKTASNTGLPLSDITFDVYNVVLGEGETVGDAPTEEELARFVTEENKVASATTDTTGYASIALDKGMYLVIEQHNADKVKAPVDPFYITIPTPVKSSNSDGESDTEITIEYHDIASIYPKNEPIEPPPPPPPPPPPDNVSGEFTIIKHDVYDESKTLGEASFQLFRAATEEDTDTQTVSCNGVMYAVVPITIDGENVILTTDENGTAHSPQLPCGVYFLVETKAPKGYVPLEEAISVTVISDLISSSEVLRIPNHTGNILPETGGPGIVWIIATGSIMLMASFTVLVAKKKITINK